MTHSIVTLDMPSNQFQLLLFLLLLKLVNSQKKLSLQALDLVPNKIHERSPVFLGSYDDVQDIKELYAAAEEKSTT